MNFLAHIADRVIGRPLLIHPQKAEVILAVLGPRIGLDRDWSAETYASVREKASEFFAMRSNKPSANRMIGRPVGGMVDEDGYRSGDLYNVANGVALIPIIGSLVNRGAFVGESSGLTSYEGLSLQLAAAAADPDVRSILLDIDSPGGEAAGMFTLAEQIRATREIKPVVALVNDMAASGAYGLASAASEITVSDSSIVGSIGVVMMHVDRSGELEQNGHKVTLIHAGAHKVDGHPFGPLSKEVKADLQRDVDNIYSRFVETVAAGRKSLTADKIKGTEARCYIGSEALDIGLVDHVGSFAETLARLSASNRTQRSKTMSANTGAAENAAHAIITQPDPTVIANATQAGATAAATRIKSIIELPEAKGREAQAQHIALNTSLTVDEAKGLLASFPVAAAADPKPATPPLAERGQDNAFNAGNGKAKPDIKKSWRDSLARAGAKLPPLPVQ